MVLNDYEGLQTEPAICILGAFESEALAIDYNKFVAAHRIEDHDLYVATMYEWIYPNVALNDALTHLSPLYRNVEQDNIMKGIRETQARVDSFNNHFESRGLTPPATDIYNDELVTP